MTIEPEALENLPAALDMAVFELTSRGLFRLLGLPPSWLAEPVGEIDLADRFPLLELFFSDCASVFSAGIPKHMESGIWEEDDATGARHYLQATAFRLGTRSLLSLKTLPRERYTYQQLFHDFQMAQEEAERQKRLAEHATQAKSDFLAMMSHEIRAPLNAIIGVADILRSTPLNPEQTRCVEIFQRNGVNLLNLVNDILDLSKVGSGKIELEAIRMDLRDVVTRAVEIIEGRAQAKALPVEISISPLIPFFVKGDPNRLRQILINLLGNSIKFTDRGHIAVRIEQDPEDSVPGHLRFAVADTGIGIPKDQLSHVFESFSQADNSTTRKYGGTGLGLFISRQFVELMGGRIWAESKIGQGSTFFFTVKLEAEADQSQPTPIGASFAPAAPERRVDGLHILLADDSEDNRFLIASYLRDAHCAIEVANNGEEALELFRSGHFDVVLMDVDMPVMDGYTASRKIRLYEEHEGLSATPIVAVTAHAFAEMQQQWQRAGFTGYLTKPIAKATLIETLANEANLARAIELESAPPVVQVEKDMEDVLPAYLERRRKEIPLYRNALGSGDFETVRLLSHRMRGTGGGYGFPLLTEIGRIIEDAALRRDAAETAASVDRLATYVETVQLDYSEGTA